MLLNSWTVMHSGWEVDAIRLYYQLTYIIPPVAGAAVGWVAYRMALAGDTD